MLCLVDDAQWLDQVSMQVLGFITRRLYAGRAGILFTVREGEAAAALAGLPELMLDGLPGEVAGELLATSAAAPVDGQVSAQIVAGTAGNPLALVELAGELTAAELAGTVRLSWPLRFGGRLEELYLSRVRALPADTRTLLLVAAAEPAGDSALVHKAAGQLGIDPEAGEATGTERLVSWKPQVRFRHPLIRSAAYYAAPAEARRRAHQALAAVTDPDRRAWHLAEAAAGPDEQVAAQLERSAGRAQARGGQAAAAAFLERAVRLTAGDPSGFYVSTWALPELIEAAARSGDMHMAGGALERLAETTQVCGTELGLGIEARSRALVAEGHAAEGMYRRRLTGWGAPSIARGSPAPTCCTANGCAASAGTPRPGSHITSRRTASANDSRPA